MLDCRLTAFALAILVAAPPASADPLDDYILAQMKRRQIPGLSLAIIDDGKIVKAAGYGVVEKGGAASIDTTTLFEAGSIGKPLTAAAVLAAVDRKDLALDEPVNRRLKSWKIPDNDFTKEQEVTLRELLSHSAGVSVPIFEGYALGDSLPSLVQILNGEKPANNKPVRVEAAPGADWIYSGGGFEIVQQLLIDVEGKSFPDIVKVDVLAPLGMASSSFEQPMSATNSAHAATGHDEHRTSIPGRWHVYPELSAAGLWTTASDLARFAIGLQQSVNGSPHAILSQAMATEMMKPQKDDYGLGVFLDGDAGSARFEHRGSVKGFESVVLAYTKAGKGVALMINTNDDSRMVPRLFRRIAELYQWPDFPTLPHRAPPATPPSAAMLATYAGRYQLGADSMLEFAVRSDHLFTQTTGIDDEEFVPASPTQFISAERNVEANFESAADGAIVAVHWKTNGSEKVAPRVAK